MENYYLYRIAIWLVGLLPVAFSYFVTGLLADLNFLINATSRRTVFANFRHVLPPGSGRWLRWRKARAAFRYFGFSIVDFFHVTRMNARNAHRFIHEIHGWEHIDRAVKAGRGGIFITVHMGSWEVAGAYLALRGVPLTAAALPHKDPRINRIFLGSREDSGMEVVPVGGALAKLEDAVERGRFIGLVVDRAIDGHGPVVQFFDRPTHVPDGHVTLALRTGAPIIPGNIYRGKGRRLVLEFCEPIVADPEHDTPEGLTRRCLSVLEEFIRARPGQWSMFHRIWPDREPDAVS